MTGVKNFPQCDRAEIRQCDGYRTVYKNSKNIAPRRRTQSVREPAAVETRGGEVGEVEVSGRGKVGGLTLAALGVLV